VAFCALAAGADVGGGGTLRLDARTPAVDDQRGNDHRRGDEDGDEDGTE
jgi:hypothetical protein